MLRIPVIAAALLVLASAARADEIRSPGLVPAPQAAPHFSFWGDDKPLPPLNNLIVQIHKAVFVAAILAHTRLGLD
jgi:hypothetical protein